MQVPGDDRVTGLILKRASASQSSGQWSDDDFDVLEEDGAVVGRIFLSPAAPEGRAWMWASGHNGDYARASHGPRADARGRDGGIREELAEGGT